MIKRFLTPLRLWRSFPARATGVLLPLLILTCGLFAQEQRTIRSEGRRVLAPVLPFLPSDTIEVMKILRMGEQLRQISPDSAFALLTKCYNRSLASGYNDGVAGSLVELGRIAALKGSRNKPCSFTHGRYGIAGGLMYTNILPLPPIAIWGASACSWDSINRRHNILTAH